jgi:hypothetical protein
MAVTFRYATYDEYPPIRQFLDEYWAKDHIYVRDRALFDWTFNRKPLWTDEGYSFALAHEGGELVGILGAIPFEFNCFGKRSTGVWIANYVIRPDHRKGSIALQLLSMFRRPCFQPVIAFGINPATATIYRVLRGEVLPHIPRYFAVLPDAVARMVKFLSIAHPEWPREKAEEVAETFRLHAIPAVTCHANPVIPSEWDTRDWPAIAERTVGAARDMQYLAWRYQVHPRFSYRFLSIPEGRSNGLLVWRLEPVRRATPEGREEVDRIGRIVEFLPASAENASALIGLFLKELKEAGAFGADFYGYHGESRAGLAANCFKPVDCHPDGDAVPSRFQPLDGKGGAILSAIFPPEGAPSCSLDDHCPWYWTKSDSDQDRPN